MRSRLPLVLSLCLLLLIGLFHFVFAVKTQLFFSQDDFAVLKYFKTHTTIEMTRQFLIVGDIWDFHKIIGYLNLRFLFDHFGVQPLPFIINNHLLHSLNLLFLFLIIFRLTGHYLNSFFFSLFFNQLYLFWFSNVHEYLVTFFSLLSIYLFFFPRWRWLSVGSLLLGLLSKEIALVVPFILVSLTYFRRQPTVRLLPHFLLLAGYLLYQLPFALSKPLLPADHPYALTSHLPTIWHNLQFYLSPVWLVTLTISLPLATTRRLLPLLLSALLSLLPALLLKNRLEHYYFYLPLAYLSLYFALITPALNRQSVLIYLIFFIIFGGRSLLPKLAWQTFPNWQRHSINQVLTRVATALAIDSPPSQISFADVKLERDAFLLLGSQVIDLFLPRNLSSRFAFNYDIDGQKLLITPRVP